MQITRHPEIEHDIKKLNKKFNTPLESLESWEMLFEVKGLTETSGIDRFPGLGSQEIYKARVVPKSESCGKSKGYRVVFKVCGDCCTILFFYRHNVISSEQEVIDTVKYRLANTST